MYCGSRLRLPWKLKSGMLCGFGSRLRTLLHYFFELTYLDPTSLADFLAVLDLLDHVRQGYFDMIHIVSSAATWSRSRHSGLPGQLLLRSRSSPLGLSSLSPEESEKIHSANRVLEIGAWVAEQTLQCPSKVIGLLLYFLKT